jgi:succinate dehydrogenase (ubiquinone) cytochrome b560 subunit
MRRVAMSRAGRCDRAIERVRTRRARAVTMSAARAIRESARRASTTRAATHAMRATTRAIGSRGVPDEYGQPATGGTGFLGTPANHRALLEKRPMSPDVFDADGSWRAHYKFPVVALSSITNRVTGVALTGAMSAGGIIALVGGAEAVPMTMEMFKANAPLAVVPVKFALSFPFVFHTLGGFRHLVWDATTKGIDNESAKTSSMAMFGVSAAASAALAAYTW